MKRLALLLVAIGGCYGPNIPNGQQQCSSDNKCADGYTCGPNHLCYKNGQVPTGDMSMVTMHDMTGVPVDLTMAPPPDLAMADLATPPCASDNDCASTPSTPRCDTGSGKCVACLATNDNCPTGQYCDGSSFTCVQGCKGDSDCAGDAGTNACCNHVCVDTTSDKNNCGACGMACGNGANACCSSMCVDTTSDAKNCGGCGMACSTSNITATCSASQCTGACAAGFADCNNDKRTDGCEQNIATDAKNCGGCNVACSTANMASVTCGGGVCNGTCANGFSDCNNNKQTDGCEQNIATDTSNCGGCGKVCSTTNMATVTCGAGVCNGTCTMGFADCNNNKQTDGCEINLNTDAKNCGACAKACSTTNMATVTCGGGVCNGTCANGFSDCDGNKQTNGCEINTGTDVNNCGRCGATCPTQCKGSVCTPDVGPTHTFVGLTAYHFITQGGCSPSGNTNQTTDANYFCQHFYMSTCNTTGFTAGSLAAPTDPKMHKNGGCTTLGTDIPGKTCDLNSANNDAACKVGNWSETTSGLNSVTCHCGQVFTDTYTVNVAPTTAQCTNWNNYRASLTGTYTYLGLRGNNDPTGVSCTGPTANTLCQAIRNGTALTGVACGGRTWNVGTCGTNSIELSADGNTCACDTGYIIRPCIANANWGGINSSTCGGPTQTISVVCM